MNKRLRFLSDNADAVVSGSRSIVDKLAADLKSEYSPFHVLSWSGNAFRAAAMLEVYTRLAVEVKDAINDGSDDIETLERLETVYNERVVEAASGNSTTSSGAANVINDELLRANADALKTIRRYLNAAKKDAEKASS